MVVLPTDSYEILIQERFDIPQDFQLARGLAFPPATGIPYDLLVRAAAETSNFARASGISFSAAADLLGKGEIDRMLLYESTSAFIQHGIDKMKTVPQ